MKIKAIFYHAGCPVCVAAEKNVASALDPAKLRSSIYINFGATTADLK